MKILLLCTDAHGGHGGIALYNRDLAAALALDATVAEVVVVPRVIHGAVGTIPEKVTVVTAAARGAAAYVSTVLKQAARRPDLVICGHINLLPLAAAIGNPVLFAWGIDVWKRPALRGLGAALRRCRAVVAISDCTLSRFLGWSSFAGPTHLLPNAIRAADYGLRPRRADLLARFGLAGKRCLLTVGRLDARERYKGCDEVLDVLPELPDDVVYMLAGDGTDVPRLKEKARALGLSSRVIFTGRFSDEEKPDLYALADAYVMPGRGEGFGFVFLEALASGLPVVGSKLDGSREALRDGALGLLVDPTSHAEVRSAIQEVLEPRPRVVPHGLAYFSFEKFSDRVNGLLSTLRMR